MRTVCRRGRRAKPCEIGKEVGLEAEGLAGPILKSGTKFEDHIQPAVRTFGDGIVEVFAGVPGDLSGSTKGDEAYSPDQTHHLYRNQRPLPVQDSVTMETAIMR